MRSYLPFVLDSFVLSLLLFTFITQIILPLWFGLPQFWLFRKAGRREVDRRFGWLIGRCPKQPNATTNKNKETTNE